MSLFIRMAQTRTGAERLLDTQLIPILSQCDYLDARPEADQSFMDRDTFLPSAIQRYHQLFMPALQFIDGMLATLGTRHATVTNQALDFLSNHSATIVILLKNETDIIALSLIEELHLLVALCAFVLPIVPKSELLSTHSGFGAIHSAILSLSTRCLRDGQWMANVKPQTDAEVANANVYGLGYGSATKFDVSVRQRARLLRKAIVEYIGEASEFTEPEITPVLSPVTTTRRHDERGSQFLTTIPTVGDALEALSELCGDLVDTLKQIADLSAELVAKDHIGVENVQDIIRDVDLDFLQELDVGQKRALICRELEHEKGQTQVDARILLSTIEMLLLLLWRHLAYYAEGHHTNTPPQKASAIHAIRFLTTTEPEVFRSETAKKLIPTLQRLATLDLDYESLGNDWRANQGYVEIMCRRLRDSAGIHDGESAPDNV